MSWDKLPSFQPSPWIRGGHTQTIMSHLLKAPKIEGKFERWVVNVDGGDELWCRFYPGTTKETVILFHGLGGCADSKYMQVCGKVARELGHSVMLVNHRGAGEGADYARGIYHAGAVSDVGAVIRFARAQRPQNQITAMGFSLSANLLLNSAALLERDLPDRIVVVNPPIDLHSTAKLMVQPQNLVYDQKFVRDLRMIMADKFQKGKIDVLPQLPRFCRLIDFDEIITAPRAGFRSRDEYYTQCSSFNYASRVQPPTLILMSEDDPFISADPFRRAKYPSHVKVHMEKFGGHVGYLSRGGRWLADFTRAALS